MQAYLQNIKRSNRDLQRQTQQSRTRTQQTYSYPTYQTKAPTQATTATRQTTTTTTVRTTTPAPQIIYTYAATTTRYTTQYTYTTQRATYYTQKPTAQVTSKTTEPAKINYVSTNNQDGQIYQQDGSSQQGGSSFMIPFIIAACGIVFLLISAVIFVRLYRTHMAKLKLKSEAVVDLNALSRKPRSSRESNTNLLQISQIRPGIHSTSSQIQILNQQQQLRLAHVVSQNAVPQNQSILGASFADVQLLNATQIGFINHRSNRVRNSQNNLSSVHVFPIDMVNYDEANNQRLTNQQRHQLEKAKKAQRTKQKLISILENYTMEGKFDKNFAEFGEISCVICFDDFDACIIRKINRCGHLFHNTCLENWISMHINDSRCPLCNLDIKIVDNDLHHNQIL
ncbi:zinc finger protein [Stylonychia lemnae]|uniref:Zinc finger protein n=1 Tax=Stylonychia lemnae TaxID=5949 RepID=A0A078AME1_STYLE|nr:zinc finger protein [Stylonychia lemnae]|eukprot:CDW83076.1 zinc finger protein [Stylonychia lemnae]